MLLPPLRAAWALCLAQLATSAPDAPFCRKSPEAHALTVPGAGGGNASLLFFFGGKGYSWMQRRRGAPQKHVQFFGSEDMWGLDVDTGRWQDLKMESSPLQRWKSGATTFDDAGKIVLFGGCVTNSPEGVMNDLWVFTPSCCPIAGRWRRVCTENPPAPRRGHVVVVNSTHLLVFGGKTFQRGHGAMIISDLWTLPLEALREGSGVAATWTQGASFPGTHPCWGSTGTVLKRPDGGEVLAVFGGRAWSDVAGQGGYRYSNELWLYDFARDSWEKASTEGDAPHARDHHGATRVNNELVVFGGRVSATKEASSNINDVWSYSLAANAWTELSNGSGHAPAPRFMPGVEAVRWHGEEVLSIVGGEKLPGSTKRTSLNDAWVFLPASQGGWREVHPAQCGHRSTGALSRKEVRDAARRPQETCSVVPVPVLRYGLITAIAGTVIGGSIVGLRLLRQEGESTVYHAMGH